MPRSDRLFSKSSPKQRQGGLHLLNLWWRNKLSETKSEHGPRWFFVVPIFSFLFFYQQRAFLMQTIVSVLLSNLLKRLSYAIVNRYLQKNNKRLCNLNVVRINKCVCEVIFLSRLLSWGWCRNQNTEMPWEQMIRWIICIKVLNRTPTVRALNNSKGCPITRHTVKILCVQIICALQNFPICWASLVLWSRLKPPGGTGVTICISKSLLC